LSFYSPPEASLLTYGEMAENQASGFIYNPPFLLLASCVLSYLRFLDPHTFFLPSSSIAEG
jgi:hypothetical protein